MSEKKKTLLIISLVYVPDPAAVGQYMADAAAEMVRRGHRVVVLTGRRGYEDPSVKYPAKEIIDGVEIKRLGLTSFGKKSMLLRFLAGWVYVLQCILFGLFTRNLSTVLVSTSPPMAPFAAIVIGMFRRVKVKFWVMDLNIDLLVKMGDWKESHPLIRFFRWMDKRIYKRSQNVVVLDRFMGDTINEVHHIEDKLEVIAPWPMDEHMQPVEHQANPFRAEQKLDGKRVIMFSGNLSIVADVDTILDASLKFADDNRLELVFIGGGAGRQVVANHIDKHKPKNVRLLPYQPLDKIKYSLSAADVHLVSVGNILVGLSHPCKIYGAMAVARPVLLLGPERCHVTDILGDHQIGWAVEHGDVAGAEKVIEQILAADEQCLKAMGQKAKQVVNEQFGHEKLRAKFCDILEK